MAPLLYRQVRTFQLTPIRQVFQYCLFFFSLKLKVFMRHDFIITPIRLYYISISIVVHYNWLWEIFWLVAAFCLYHAHLIFDVRVTITYKHFQRHILIFRAQVRFLSVQRSQDFRLLHGHFYVVLWRREQRHVWQGKFGLRLWIERKFAKIFNGTFVRILLAIWVNDFAYLIQLPYHLCRIRNLSLIHLCSSLVVACGQPNAHPWAVSCFLLLQATLGVNGVLRLVNGHGHLG